MAGGQRWLVWYNTVEAQALEAAVRLSDLQCGKFAWCGSRVPNPY